MSDSNNLLSKILYEAKSYNTFDDIEKLVDGGQDLSMIPIQPLYVSLINSPSDLIAQILPRLSPEQRQTLVDLDLWKRDVVDVHNFETWIEVYSKIEDLDLTQEFVESEDFLLYLKARINLHTFDVDDPMYPDHDFYFLTDDMLLLVEYSEAYQYPNELKYLIRNLYAKKGVEGAYTLLFKLVNDSFPILQEHNYQLKNSRLEEFGFVSYFEAIEKLHALPVRGHINAFIKSKNTLTPNINIVGQNQSLHSSALVSFDSEMEDIYKELSLVADEKRMQFLHFTFIRLINSTITQKDALRSGRIELTRIGKVTKNCLELGIQYIRKIGSVDNSVFDNFDFFDVYKVGNSLLSCERNKYLKVLKKSPFETDDYEYFLGAWWNSFLENSDLEVPKVKTYGAALHTKHIDNLASFDFWCDEIKLFVESIPFINSFFQSYITLKNDGKLLDEFYLNYEVENIDFESIIISSFINYSLGNYGDTNVNKMGITISEMKIFFSKFFVKRGEEFVLKSLDESDMFSRIEKFLETFGFDKIDGMEKYLHGILSEHLSGYEFDTLADEDFKHIGGPILLNYISN